MHLYFRDIFDNICKLRVRNLLDFEWQAQCRFYYNDENDDVDVKITDVIFLYQNEYLGITERLAITPLTDRCYITLAQAICMFLPKHLLYKSVYSIIIYQGLIWVVPLQGQLELARPRLRKIWDELWESLWWYLIVQIKWILEDWDEYLR